MLPARGTYAIGSCEPSQMGNQAALSSGAMRRRNTCGSATIQLRSIESIHATEFVCFGRMDPVATSLLSIIYNSNALTDSTVERTFAWRSTPPFSQSNHHDVPSPSKKMAATKIL